MAFSVVTITCRVSDPLGNLYWIHQRIEDVSEEEMVRRMSDPVFAKNMEYVQSSLFRPAVD
jgi:PhnB protein